MEEPSDLFDKLPDEVFQLIFLAVSDCKTLVRCMAVSKSFKDHSERVSTLSIVCPGDFTSYVDKLQRIYSMVRRFQCLEVLVVRVGQPKEEPPSWARCMRYAEIGSTVEKFIFMAAKTGEFSEFDSALRGVPSERSCRKESSSDGEPEAGSSGRNRVNDQVNEQTNRETSCLATCQTSESSTQQPSFFPDFNLRQVVAPSNDVLKRMVPVIVFAIVQGLDEFRDSVPDFIRKFDNLRSFLLVDMLESVTVFMREHHIQEIRARQEIPSCSKHLNEGVNEEADVVADKETEEISRHDPGINLESGSQVEGPSASKGKAVDPENLQEEPGDKKQKGKEVESDLQAEDRCRSRSPGESSSGVSSFRSDEVDDEEVTSTLRRTADGNSIPDQPHGKWCSGYSLPRVSSSEEDGRLEEKTSSDDNADTAWRHCPGICIHEATGEHGFVSKYKRTLKGRDSRSMKAGSYRRRERSADWMDESVRRRQENRWFKGLGFRRREESKALKSWRLGKRDRDPELWDGGSSSSSSSSAYSFPAFTGIPSPEIPVGDTESSSSSRPQQSMFSFGLTPTEGPEKVPENAVNSSSSDNVDNSHVNAVNSNVNDNSVNSNVVNSESEATFGTRFRDEDHSHFRWGRNDDITCQQQGGGFGPLRSGVRMIHRDAWRETWGERLGRRARDLRREMQNAANAEMEREGIRRERLREGVRKRQMEIEREALRFDITFWRAEQVSTRNYSLADVSMCIATHASKPLASREISSLNISALAGPLLAATITHVNEQASFHNL